MAKQLHHAHSRYSTEAIALLGQLIRAGRLERKITGGEMARRMGVSRDLLRRIEKGDPSCSIGAVFEAAAITGVPLFESDREGLRTHRAVTGEILRLLPNTAHKPRRAVKDEF